MVLESLTDVVKEMKRQVQLFGVQHLPPGTGGPFAADQLDHARMMFEQASKNGFLTWMDILREEYCEVIAETEPAKIREELVQCAAVCLSWIRDIDSNRGDTNDVLPSAAQEADFEITVDEDSGFLDRLRPIVG